MEISYKKVGDYYIPEMVFPNAKLDKNIGKYGRLRLNYLKHNHMDIYTILLMDDKLNEHLLEIEKEAKKQVKILVENMCKKENATEKLKENQEIAVILEKNASSDKNARKNSEEQHLSFSTLKNLSVMWTDLEAGSYSNYSNPVKIIFNHQLKENSEEFISSLISTEPEMPVTKENIKSIHHYLINNIKEMML